MSSVSSSADPAYSVTPGDSDRMIRFGMTPVLLFLFAAPSRLSLSLLWPLLGLGCSRPHLSKVACVCRHVDLVVEIDGLVLWRVAGIGGDPGQCRCNPGYLGALRAGCKSLRCCRVVNPRPMVVVGA